MFVRFARKLCESHPARFSRLALPLVRAREWARKTAGQSVDVPQETLRQNRRSDRVSSTGPILSAFPKVRHVADHSSYWRRLDTDPSFAAEMSERQARIGQWPRSG